MKIDELYAVYAHDGTATVAWYRQWVAAPKIENGILAGYAETGAGNAENDGCAKAYINNRLCVHCASPCVPCDNLVRRLPEQQLTWNAEDKL